MMKKLIIFITAIAILGFLLAGCGAQGDVSASAEGSEDSDSTAKAEIVTEIDASQIANPWGETQSLDVATESSGVDFIPPQELPPDVELTTYRYMEGTIEALYVQTDNEMVLRKSTALGGAELSGDYNTYSKEWDEDIGGITVHCRGDGESINSAFYDKDGAHYSILYNAGEEGKGLTLPQLNSLVGEIA